MGLVGCGLWATHAHMAPRTTFHVAAAPLHTSPGHVTRVTYNTDAHYTDEKRPVTWVGSFSSYLLVASNVLKHPSSAK